MSELVTGAQNSVIFWEEKALTRRRNAQPFPDSNYHISSLSWSANNNKLAVVPQCGDRVAVCELKDDILTWSHLVHKDGGVFTCGCLLSNSRYLASGCGNSSVLLWDLKHKQVLKTFQGHSGAVSSVAVTANDHLLVSGGCDGHIFLQPLTSSSKAKTIQLTKDQTAPQPISRLSVSAMEQSHLGCVCVSGEVSLWSIDSQRRLTTFSTKHSGGATDLSFTPSNKILMVSVGLDSCIRCFDLQTRKTVATIATPSPLHSVSILRDGSTLLAGGSDGQLYLYELRYLKTPKSVTEAHQTAVTCITPQAPFKTPAKKSTTKGQESQHKGQLSPETTLLQSGDKSPPKVQRPSQNAPKTRPYHALPETVTPFVTQRPGGVALEVTTPYSIVKQTKEEWPARRGLPLTSVMATPAASDQGNMSSIFSPLEPHHRNTPTTSASKITAAVPPTQRRGEIPTSSAQATVTTQNGRVSSTPLVPAPPSSGCPSSTPLVSAPPPNLPLATPLIQGSKSTQLSNISLGASIFSPLSHTDSLVGQSPLLQVNHSSADKLVTSTVTQTPTVAGSHVGHGTQTPVVAGSHDGHVTWTPTEAGSHDGHVTSVSDSKPQVSLTVDTPSVAVAASPVLHPSPPGSSCDRHECSGDETTHKQSGDMDNSLPEAPGAVDDRGDSPRAPPPLMSGVHTQYLERVIRDSTEELWYSVHRDTRGLTVDIIKQFLALQEGLAHQFAALNEKVDRLSEENRKLQELVHRYMPKH